MGGWREEVEAGFNRDNFKDEEVDFNCDNGGREGTG